MTTTAPPEDNNDKNKDIVLTDEQKAKILELFTNSDKPMMVKDIILAITGQQLDARTKWGMAIREFISQQGLTYRGAREYIPPKVVELNEEQKLFITNNCGAMKPLEMARTIFNNRELTNLDVETRKIYEYIKTLPNNVSNKIVSQEDLVIDEYKPPKTEDQTIARINKFVNNANFNKEKLTEKQKRDIRNLIGYLHTVRFLQEIATYPRQLDRDLFESEFIRCTYNRDLEEQEVSQYIMYASDVVTAKQIKKRIQELDEAQDEQMAENNNRPNMALVESINSMRRDYDQCIGRQKTLIKALEGERQKRMENQKEDNTSILDLLSYWKDYERRQHLAKLADIRDQTLKDEIERLKSLPDIIVEIFGASDNELLGGK